VRPSYGPGVKPALSIYFDFARAFAALAVVLTHLSELFFPNYSTVIPGHDAVMLFFVLSGYVIAYVSDRPSLTLRRYLFDRLSRLWSVQVPAALLAGVAMVLVGAVQLPGGTAWAPTWSSFLLDTIANLTFLGQGWSSPILSPYNTPVWSLNYEAWYYAIFAAWIFLPGRTRIFVGAALCVLAGPKVMALMPCWLAGVVLYRYRDRIVMGERAAAALFIGALALYAVCYALDTRVLAVHFVQRISHGQSYHLGWSTPFLSDYFVALLVSAQFAAVMSMPRLGQALERWKAPIVWAASYTLSLYLFHMPLAIMLFAGAGLDAYGTAGALITLSAILLSVVLLGTITEHRRSDWRRWMAWIFSIRSFRRATAPANQ